MRSASFSRRLSRPENSPLSARASAGVLPVSMSSRHLAVFSSISLDPAQSRAERSTASSMVMPLAVAMDMEEAKRETAIWPSRPRPPKRRLNAAVKRLRSAGTSATTSTARAMTARAAPIHAPALEMAAPNSIMPAATPPMRTPSCPSTRSNTGSTWVISRITTANMTTNSTAGTVAALRTSDFIRFFRS